jgi:methylase of polypeptide subunit release factors
MSTWGTHSKVYKIWRHDSDAKADVAARQDTAASVTHLAHLLRRAKDLPQELRVLDLCTGTGCIPLLFQHEFCTTRSDSQLRILGVDIAQKAINLAQHNARRILGKQSTKVDFVRADVLIEPWGDQTLDPPCMKAALNFNRLPYFWDILVSNPPYISPSAFWKTTTRSVRGFEPKLALVPPPSKSGTDEQQGDAFYPRLLTIAQDVEAKIVLLEVADLKQASRVAHMAREMNIFDGIEIWKDQPDQDSSTNDQEDTSDPIIPIIGTGNGRSVLCWRGKGTAWLERSIESTSPVSSQKSSECDEASQHTLLPVFDFHR